MGISQHTIEGHSHITSHTYITMSTITLSPHQLQQLVSAAASRAVKDAMHARHHTDVVEYFEDDTDTGDNVVTKKGKTTKSTKTAAKKKGNKEGKNANKENKKAAKKAGFTADGHELIKLDKGQPHSCDCPTREDKDCEATAWFELENHPTYVLVCGKHADMLRDGKHIGPKPKVEQPLCAGTTKKGNACKRHAMKNNIYCWNHADDDNSE